MSWRRMAPSRIVRPRVNEMARREQPAIQGWFLAQTGLRKPFSAYDHLLRVCERMTEGDLLLLVSLELGVGRRDWKTVGGRRLEVEDVDAKPRLAAAK